MDILEALTAAKANGTPVTVRWAANGKIMRRVYVIDAGRYETSLAKSLDAATTTIFSTEDLRLVTTHA
jgi:hypothetical protein